MRRKARMAKIFAYSVWRMAYGVWRLVETEGLKQIGTLCDKKASTYPNSKS
jgi:hypothetical protein